MPVSTLDSVDSSVAQLFLASRHSLDPATADFMLRRVAPVTIYIEGDYDDLPELPGDIRDEAVRIMHESGYSQIGEWGPYAYN